MTVDVQSYLESWSYQNPKLWARKNRYCGGRSQSPINIRFNRSVYNTHLKPISLEERDPTGIPSNYISNMNFACVISTRRNFE